MSYNIGAQGTRTAFQNLATSRYLRTQSYSQTPDKANEIDFFGQKSLDLDDVPNQDEK